MRTLLGTATKRILEETGTGHSDKDDLPKLYAAAKVLNLAPSRHSEEPFKAILGGAMNLVNGIGHYVTVCPTHTGAEASCP